MQRGVSSKTNLEHQRQIRPISISISSYSTYFTIVRIYLHTFVRKSVRSVSQAVSQSVPFCTAGKRAREVLDE